MRILKKYFVIYKATNKKTGACYIGATSRGMAVRKRAHLKCAMNANGVDVKYLHHRLRRYGGKCGTLTFKYHQLNKEAA
jgi:hypothetical protein